MINLDLRKLYLRLMKMIDFFDLNYPDIRVADFDSRFLAFSKLKSYLDIKFPEKQKIGNSFLGNDIYLLQIGHGKKKVLAWSQMHGNESTGTRAMLDVFEFLKQKDEIVEKILDEVSFYFIPMLNPDGSTLYTRRNACGIDLNRDFVKESSVEIKVLKKTVDELKPDFLFNLHDQRSIFNVSGTFKPATLSFLAPSPDKQRSVTEARKKAMDIIAYISINLESFIPGHIARFSDEFYPTSTGDNFMKEGFTNILFEAGHFPNDYHRNHVRKFNALAILLAFEKIAVGTEDQSDEYQKIPENDNKMLDILLRNVVVKSEKSEALTDIGIYFEEKLENEEIKLNSRIEEIGDLTVYGGHIDLDMEGEVYIGKSSCFPEVGKNADFSVGGICFENGKFIN